MSAPLLLLFLLLGLVLACTPAPTMPTAPAPPEVPVIPMASVLPLPDTCTLQIALPATGYRLRLWDDGHITEGREGAEQLVDPYDITLRDPERLGAFVREQQQVWSVALALPLPQTPPVADGTPIPGGRVRLVPIEVALHTAEGGVQQVQLQGDLRHPPTLEPLQTSWEALQRRIRPPDR